MKEKNRRWFLATLGRRVADSAALRKIVGNTGWLIAGRMVRPALGFLVGIWVARHLGPQSFGILSYAIALLSIAQPIARMGTDPLISRDLVRRPEARYTILGTSFALRLTAGLASFAVLVVVVGWLRPGDDQAALLVTIMGAGLVVGAFTVIEPWFESQVAARQVVLATTLALLATAALRVFLILDDAPLFAFATAILVEFVLISLFLVVAYRATGQSPLGWRVDGRLVRRYLAQAWPLTLSGLAIAAYMRIDQVMIGALLDDRAVGLYATTIRLVEILYILPTSIVASVFPALVRLRSHDPDLYRRRLQLLYDGVTWLAIAVAVPVSLAAPWIIRLVFGAAYVEAWPALTIAIWSAVFGFQGTARARWVVIEGLQTYSPVFAGGALAINVVLNFALIPPFGIAGAAIATLASQASAAILIPLLMPAMRPSALMLLASYTRLPTLYRQARQAGGD